MGRRPRGRIDQRAVGLDTHTPFNIGKVLWWCPTALAFDNPEHGSKYDEYGLKLGGPAPTGLPSYQTRSREAGWSSARRVSRARH